ncbi:RidA family protein [Paraglaciecola sp. L1A13]|uniref:RidA family protein n=1 Tax=Paraglaciecola sp. L1A13 TaxID=2686359 RepID=UPI00131D5EE5|nr:RidA family protein [Paraglaciecola sp. L1A13]
MKRLFILFSTTLLCISSNAHPQPDHAITRLSSDAFKQHNLPFSQAVRVNDILYLSGESGVISGQLKRVEDGVIPETRQALDNIKSTLERFSSGMDNVIAGSGLGLGGRVEIEFIALAPNAQHQSPAG